MVKEELSINVYDAMTCILKIIEKIEQKKYYLRLYKEKAKDQGEEKYYIYYDIVSEENPLEINLSFELFISNIPENLEFYHLLERLMVPMLDFKQSLLECYDLYPFLYKYFQLLEEINYVGMNRVTPQLWQKIYTISLYYAEEIQKISEARDCHIKKIKIGVMN